MTDRYDHLAAAPDPARAGALLDELHARLGDPDGEQPRSPTPTDDRGPRRDEVVPLPSYSDAPDDRPGRRSHTWRRVVAVAAAVVIVVPAVFALTRLGDKRSLETGPVSTADSLEPDGPKVVATVPATEPLEVKAVDGAVWAANAADGTVSRVNPADNRVVATIDSLPALFRLDATNDAVWIVGVDGDPAAATTMTVIRIDPATNERVATLAIPVSPELTGFDVATTDDAVWVAAGTSVTRIDPATDEVTATIPLDTHPIYVDATDDAVWVTSADDGSDQLTRIDPSNDEVVTTVPGLTGAGDLVVTADSVWVVEAANETLVQVDPASNRVVGQVTLPSGVGGLAVGDAVVWVTLMDGNLYRIDPATRTLTKTLDLGLGTDTSLSLTGDALWATSITAGTVTRIDPGSR